MGDSAMALKNYARDIIPGLECEKVRSIDGPYLAFYDEEGDPKWKIVQVRGDLYHLMHNNEEGEYGWHSQHQFGKVPDMLFQIAMHEAYEKRLLRPHDKRYRFWNLTKMIKLLRGELREN